MGETYKSDENNVGRDNDILTCHKVIDHLFLLCNYCYSIHCYLFLVPHKIEFGMYDARNASTLYMQQFY